MPPAVRFYNRPPLKPTWSGLLALLSHFIIGLWPQLCLSIGPLWVQQVRLCLGTLGSQMADFYWPHRWPMKVDHALWGTPTGVVGASSPSGQVM